MSRFADKWLMSGATEEFGTSVGVYETGCGSIGQVLWAGTKFTGLLVLNGVSIFNGAKVLSDVPCLITGTGCFTAGTQVVMADGCTKAIEKVKADDLVLTRDQNDDANGKVVAKRVLKTSVREAQATVSVTLATGEKIECTPEHPFYAAGKGFVEAKDLGIGTSIVTRAGPAVQVASVERHDAPATVYNLVVDDTHTYFVGTANGGVEVHNTCPLTGEELAAARQEFNSITRPSYWKAEAATNPDAYTADNLARMVEGKAPIGEDGFPMELHHNNALSKGGANSPDNLDAMTRTEHRLGDNYRINHRGD